MPSKEEYDSARVLKHGDFVNKTMKNSIIGVAGLGGLGSNICSMLTRMGAGKLVIVDFDTVDLTNMNRQNYFERHLNMKKTVATEEILKDIDPNVRVEKFTEKLNPDNIKGIFNGCDIVCEALDSAAEKTMFIQTILAQCPGVRVVSGSGMAGYGKSNAIRTEKKLDRLYLCGDGVDLEDCESIMTAPRVILCAAHMANTVVAVLNGKEI